MEGSIIFVGNPASISYLIGNELIKYGYEVDISDNPSLFRTNRLQPPQESKPSLVQRAIRRAKRELKISSIKTYDVELRSFSKPVVRAKHHVPIYHGNDLRDDLMAKEYPCFYTTIDLYDRYLDHTLPSAWLPRCVVNDLFTPKPRLPFDGKNLVLGHFATDPKMEQKGWQSKGTGKVYRAVEILQNRGYSVTLLTPERTGFVAHERMQQLYERCHVVLDQFNVGMYGIVSLESIMCNRPVVCYVKPEYYEFDDMAGQIATCQPNPESIADVVIEAIEMKVNPDLIPRLYSPKLSAQMLISTLQMWGCLK